MPESRDLINIITSRLAPHLGPNVARMAMKTSSQKALGIAPENVQINQAGAVIDAIRPMLNVMLGRDHAETIVQDIRKDLGW
jgi:hypothetical protein